MSDSFFVDLNKQDINDFSLSFTWPSLIFWLGNVWLAVHWNPELITRWNGWETDNKILVVGFFGILIVTTAYLLYTCLPFIYVLLQGRPVRMSDFFLRRHQKRVKHLQQKDMDLAQKLSDLQQSKSILIETVQTTTGQKDCDFEQFKAKAKRIRKALSGRFGIGYSSSSLTNHPGMWELKQLVTQLDSCQSTWNQQSDFVVVQNRLIRYYRDILNHLERRISQAQWQRTATLDQLTNNYPSAKTWIAPTSFGNAWTATEMYSASRYGIALALIWPRLVSFLSDGARTTLSQAKAQIDSWLSCWTLLGLFWIFWSTWALMIRKPIAVCTFTAIVLGGLAGQLVFYRLSLDASIRYGKLVKAFVDVFRMKVLQEMALAQPTNIAQEKEIWSSLTAFWTSNAEAGRLQFKDTRETPTQEHQ